MNKKVINETHDIVDFGLFYSAKQYYEAARLIKDNDFVNMPYSILLSFSIELFLKSIRTTIIWPSAVASKVDHTQGHNLTKIFNTIEKKYPVDANNLKNKYLIRFNRSLKEDIDLNSEVFIKKRYPYLKDGTIPSIPYPKLNEFAPRYDNDIAIYTTQLEDVADFLHDELIVHFNGLFEDMV